jgi:hypothetical protein
MNTKGYKELLQSVIKLAVSDGDEEFIKSQVFDDYCYYLGIKDDIALEAIRERCLKQIRGNKK